MDSRFETEIERTSQLMITVGKEQVHRAMREKAPYRMECLVSWHFVISRCGGKGPELFHILLESGGESLPVLSSRDAARDFVRHYALEPEWHVKECSAGELVSLLIGPYANTEWVLLDPLPWHLPSKDAPPNLVHRESFTSQLLEQRV
jgi:hypothetical protein